MSDSISNMDTSELLSIRNRAKRHALLHLSEGDVLEAITAMKEAAAAECSLAERRYAKLEKAKELLKTGRKFDPNVAI